MAHLHVFLAAILGFQIGTPAPRSNPDNAHIGTLDEETGELLLSAAEVQKVHRRYKQLSSNRTDHVLKMRMRR